MVTGKDERTPNKPISGQQGTKRAPESEPSPSTSKKSKEDGSAAKRKLEDPNDESSAGKKQLTGVTPAKEAAGTTQQAQPIAGKPTGGPDATGTQPMQVDEPAGNSHNTKGTVQGESGTRKIQKPRGAVFGLIQVNMADETSKNQYNARNYQKTCNHYICVFKKVETAEKLFRIINITWQNIAIVNFKWEEYFVVAFELRFNIKWSTLKDKLGSPIQTTKYMYKKILNSNFDDEEALKEEIDLLLRTLLDCDVEPINIEKEIENEKQRELMYGKRGNNSEYTKPPSKKLKAW